MSTLTTITVINTPNAPLTRIPNSPYVRFFGSLNRLSQSILTIQELPSLHASLDPSQPLESDILPVVQVQLPITGVPVSVADVERHLIVSVYGYLRPNLMVDATMISILDNQLFLTMGYENDKYSNAVLQKVKLVQYLSRFSTLSDDEAF